MFQKKFIWKQQMQDFYQQNGDVSSARFRSGLYISIPSSSKVQIIEVMTTPHMVKYCNYTQVYSIVLSMKVYRNCRIMKTQVKILKQNKVRLSVGDLKARTCCFYLYQRSVQGQLVHMRQSRPSQLVISSLSFGAGSTSSW